jgi:beta-galactosidase
MLPHGGAHSRIFREVGELGGRLGELADARGTRVHASVAILWDWESFWAQDLEWRPSADLSHREQIETYYTRLWHDGVTVDFAHPEHDLSRYALVIAPSLYLLSDDASANLERYVESGGHLVVSCFSGIVDDTDTVPAGPMPGGLRTVLGIEIDEFLPLRRDQRVALSTGVDGDVWTDSIVLRGAASVADYLDGPAAGGPAITRNTHGRGTAWYVSTRVDADGLSAVLAPVLAEAGIEQPGAGHPQLEVIERAGEAGRYTVYINHADEPATLETADGPLTISAGGTHVSRSATTME